MNNTIKDLNGRIWKFDIFSEMILFNNSLHIKTQDDKLIHIWFHANTPVTRVKLELSNIVF